MGVLLVWIFVEYAATAPYLFCSSSNLVRALVGECRTRVDSVVAAWFTFFSSSFSLGLHNSVKIRCNVLSRSQSIPFCCSRPISFSLALQEHETVSNSFRLRCHSWPVPACWLKLFVRTFTNAGWCHLMPRLCRASVVTRTWWLRWYDVDLITQNSLWFVGSIRRSRWSF